jgi:hypothetical protein
MSTLFDPNPGLRTEAEWRALLGGLVESLSQYTGIEFVPTSWFTADDTPGYASSSNCVNIRGTINRAMALDACGVVCVSINFGEAVWAFCDLLLFSAGQRIYGPVLSEHRLYGPTHGDLIVFDFTENGWRNQGWTCDANKEWESYTTDEDERWSSE